MEKLQKSKYKYLFGIDSPADLKKIPAQEIGTVCDEVREFMIDTITKTGGHFGAGLGVVELTVALHYVYDTPTDKIIWDVGHQGYPHKIITGRRDMLHTIRQHGGISGFLKTEESKYDAFGAGHASTSISAALGMATARDLQHKDFKVIAVIGDGAMTGGMAFEAMNNCGVQKRDITVILNDNDASIAANVSAISNYFNEVFASGPVQKLRGNIWNLAGKMDELGDRLRKYASKFEKGVKAIVTPGILFEAFGFKYFGPVDGNNIQKVIRMLRLIKDMHGPILLHVITTKGKGYSPAENDKNYLHAIGKIDRETGKSISKDSKYKHAAYQDVFGHAMVEICEKNNKVVGITAAMPDGTGLDILQREMPDRVFDTGIAEAHAVTFAAGLAIEGITPVCAIYSTFLQRGFDQIVHDCALQKLHVVFALDRSGLVGADGPTHHGILDIVYLRSIPNMVLMAPKDQQELRNMLHTAINIYKDGPIAIRYPRGQGNGFKTGPMVEIPIGQSEIIRRGSDIAILALGKMVEKADHAGDKLEKIDISAEVINARFVKPLDTEMLDDIFTRFDKIITIEDGQASGGFGSAVLEYLATKDETEIKPHIEIMGLPDEFITHGTQDELHEDVGLSTEAIVNKSVQLIHKDIKEIV